MYATAPPDKILVHSLNVFTRTAPAKLPNVDYREDRIDYAALQLTPGILAVNSNYGHVARVGCESYLKQPKPPVVRPGRRQSPRQGDGSCFNSCISVTCAVPPALAAHPQLKSKKFYASKIFRNGSTQIYGVRLLDKTDGLTVLQYLADFVAANPCFRMQEAREEQEAPAGVIKDDIVVPTDAWTTKRVLSVDASGEPCEIVLPVAPTYLLEEKALVDEAATLPEIGPPVLINSKSELNVGKNTVIDLEALHIGINKLNRLHAERHHLDIHDFTAATDPAGADALDENVVIDDTDYPDDDIDFPIGICTIMRDRMPKLRFSHILPLTDAEVEALKKKTRGGRSQDGQVLVYVFKSGKINVLGLSAVTAHYLPAVEAATCRIFRILWSRIVVRLPEPDMVDELDAAPADAP